MNFKGLRFLLAVGLGIGFAQDFYEEKAYLGVHAEIMRMDNIEFSYYQVPDSFDEIVAKYTLDGEPEAGPLIGLAGNLPFLWNPYFNATMVAGFQQIDYKLKSTDPRAIAAGSAKKDITTYTVVIQGGPELGYPIIADRKNDQMFKILAFSQVIIGKTFLNEKADVKNDAYFGFNYGTGLRFAKGRFAIGAGIKFSEWIWKPLFDDSKGYNIDEAEGRDKVNRVRVRFSQVADPYLDIKYSIF